MKYLTTLFSIGLLLGGCGTDEGTVADEPVTVMDTSMGTYAQANENNLDFGDVEAGLELEVIVAEEDIPEGANATELRSASKKKLNMMTLDIAGAAPSVLPITMLVKTKTDFSANPVVLRGKLLREIEIGVREEIFSFNTLADVVMHQRRDEDPTQGPFPSKFSTDALAGLEGMPETMLLYLEVEAIQAGLEADKSQINLATITGSTDEMGILMSNALRINYVSTAKEEPVLDTISDVANMENLLVVEGAPETEPAEEEAPAAQ